MVSRLERRIKRKEERQEKIHEQRKQYSNRERNKRIFNYAIAAVVVIIVGYFLYSTLHEEPGKHDSLAKCLTSKGVVMYGTDWCPHCQDQKRLFGSSFRYMAYVNCDVSPEACSAAGVVGYPTWVFPRGEKMSGTVALDVLAQRAECSDA
jgi:hypothetical protein